MAVAVGDGAVAGTHVDKLFEFTEKDAPRPPAVRVWLIWVKANWAFSWASRKEAACCPINNGLPGSPPRRG